MTSFYTEEELKQLGLKSYGKNVKISRNACFYGAEHISIGDYVRIDDFCILSGCVTLANFIHIAAYTALYGGEAGIYIDDFANLSSRICVYAVSDDYSGNTMTSPIIPEKYKAVKSEPVYIRKHVIIGTTSVVMPGVLIAEGSAFGSFSFINRDSEAWSINVGIPFEKIKNRSQTVKELENQFMRENNL